MSNDYDRLILDKTLRYLTQSPAAVLLGPRQVGKTTLAKHIAKVQGGVYFDLERPSDLFKLSDPEFALTALQDKLVVLDEVQHLPELFRILRPLIDDNRRPGRFLLLGSASPALLNQASESLAGRIGLIEMSPLLVDEIKPDEAQLSRLLLRGGFPDSFTANSDRASFEWRESFVRTFIELDMPQLGFRFDASSLQRFWTMVAHWHGQLWNASRIAASMGVSAPAVTRYLDALEGAFMLRKLAPMEANVMKRLVKSPKVYVRDCGVLHHLLGIQTSLQLQGHPVVGASWEGLVIEQLLGQLPTGVQANFYRTAAGTEVDLVLHNSHTRIAIECKYSSSPKPTRGFYEAMKDLDVKHGYVVAPVKDSFALSKDVTVLPVFEIQNILNHFAAP
jgi:predicted AAA+ superfamily ATPase